MIERRKREGERKKGRRRERERKVEEEIYREMCAHSKQSVAQINVRPL